MATGTSAALVGAMLPLSNTPGSVAVWAIQSEFNQFTDWPTFTDTGLGEYTPFSMVTVSRLGGFTHSGFVGVGVHGPVGLFELPHPLAMSAPTIAMSVHRTEVCAEVARGFLRHVEGQAPVLLLRVLSARVFVPFDDALLRFPLPRQFVPLLS